MIILVFFLAVTAAAVDEVIVNQISPDWTTPAPVQLPTCQSCILMNTTCYQVSYLFDFDAPFRKQIVIHKMGLHRSTNHLFFSFEPMIEDEEYFKTGFVNLDNPAQSGIISGGQILNFGTFDIDQANNMIYFGGNDGIFVLDTNSSKMSSYSSRGDTITNVFFRNYVYFVKYEDKGVIVKKGDFFSTILETWKIRKFVVTTSFGKTAYVFLSNFGLFVSNGNSNNAHRVSKNAYFRGLTVDLDDNVYAWWVDGIYKVVFTKDLIHSKIVRVAKIPSIGAITFDNNNNILFTSDKSLYLMAKTDNSNCGITNVN